MRNSDSPKEISGKTRIDPGVGGGDTPFVIVFTDLDGTLLDHDTYSWEEARPALATCHSRGVPVVMVSSKTRAEMDIMRIELGFRDPFISENGGGIFFPKDGVEKPPPEAVSSGNYWVWSLGPPYGDLVEALRDIRKELGWGIRGFSDMAISEIAGLTGLDRDVCRLAAGREYDEPFVLEKPGERAISRLEKAAEERGLRVSVGGRFFHLHGKNDKAEAVQRLISWYKKKYRRIITIGLGDSPNDFGMLKGVAYPVLIRSVRRFPGIERELSGLRITEEMGPKGWNAAILNILQELEGGLS